MEKLLITQQNGICGLTMDEIRDYLVENGYNHGLSFDGSGSATLVTDHEIIVQPEAIRDPIIPSGATFRTIESDNKEKDDKK